MNQKFINQRLPLGSKFEELIIRFLRSFEQLEIINTSLLKEQLEKDLDTNIWKQDQFKKYKPLVMLRWLPDLMVINPKKKFLFLLMLSLCILQFTWILFLNKYLIIPACRLKKHEIGNIEREVYDSYISWIKGAKVAIISLATFHPNLILSDFADQMEILFRDERERNHFSSGSTTPR